MPRIFQGLCKDCEKPFSFSEEALFGDASRGLSPPSRCPACRKKKYRQINKIGVAYWSAPREYDPNKQQWGKMGLRKLSSNPAKPTLLEYSGEPVAGIESKFEVLDPVVEALIANLENPRGSRVSVLVGPTGTGKSVWFPYRLLRSKVNARWRICVTQPRLITLRKSKDADETSTTPGFISKMLLQSPGVGAGHEIGFRYHGEYDHYDRYTRLLYVTDGTVINWIVSGEIRKFDILVVDEAHELSTNMVLILSLLRYQLALYPRLRLVVASATANVQMFRDYFAPICPEGVFVAEPNSVHVGTPKPIHRRWPTGENGYAEKIPGFKLPQSPADLPLAAAQVVKAICQVPGFTKLGKQSGDILIFMPTIKLLRETIARVEELRISKIEVLACYAKMPDEENSKFRRSEERASRAFAQSNSSNPQRVIVTTTYAETGVTMNNLLYVIDGGYTMEPEWNPAIVSFDYVTKRHSQAGCQQREGRVGRIQEGEVFKLYTEEDFNNPNIFAKHTLPEISRTSLDKFLLTAKAAGITSLSGFQFLGETADPQKTTVERERALKVLVKHGAIDEDGDITRRGVELDRLQTSSVDLSMCLSESDAFACSLEVATFFAFLDQPRGVFLDGEVGAMAYVIWRTQCRDDLEYYLRLFTAWEKAGRNASKAAHKSWSLQQGFNHNAFVDIAETRKRMLAPFVVRTHTDPTERLLDLQRLPRVRLVLAKAVPEWVYVKDASGLDRFVPFRPAKCPCQEPLRLSENSATLGQETLKAFICFERRQISGTVYAEHVVEVAASWLEALEQSQPLSLALMLNREAARMDKVCGSSGERVLLSPGLQLARKDWTLGEVVGGVILRQISYDRKSDVSTYVMNLESRNAVAIVVFKGDRNFSPGVFVRAKILSIWGEEPRLALDDDGFAKESYPLGKVQSGLVHSALCDRETEEPYGYLVQLERGVLGRLMLKNTWSNSVARKPLRIGAAVDVEIKEHKATGMELCLAKGSVFAGFFYSGVVVDFLPGKAGHRLAGAFVEFAPRVVGLVHHLDISATRLQNLKKGDDLRVYLKEISTNGDKTRYQLVDDEFHLHSRK